MTAYHTDVSHLASIVRIAPLLSDPSTIALAIELTDYGCKLSGRHVYDGDPPFWTGSTKTIASTSAPSTGQTRRTADRSCDPFPGETRTPPHSPPNEPPESGPALQVLVGLLVRLGRLDQAIAVARRTPWRACRSRHSSARPWPSSVSALANRRNSPGSPGTAATSFNTPPAILGQPSPPMWRGVGHTECSRRRIDTSMPDPDPRTPGPCPEAREVDRIEALVDGERPRAGLTSSSTAAFPVRSGPSGSGPPRSRPHSSRASPLGTF